MRARFFDSTAVDRFVGGFANDVARRVSTDQVVGVAAATIGREGLDLRLFQRVESRLASSSVSSIGPVAK